MVGLTQESLRTTLVGLAVFSRSPPCGPLCHDTVLVLARPLQVLEPPWVLAHWNVFFFARCGILRVL